MKKLEKFRILGLSENTLLALEKKGFEEPTPIQQKTVPLLLKGEVDIIGQAQTGTGKTAAFGLPILEGIHEKSKTVQALILVPTRELAEQVAKALSKFSKYRPLGIVAVYGGVGINPQLKGLRTADVAVGTPGRILDHIAGNTIRLGRVKTLVLDEADRMLTHHVRLRLR